MNADMNAILPYLPPMDADAWLKRINAALPILDYKHEQTRDLVAFGSHDHHGDAEI